MEAYMLVLIAFAILIPLGLLVFYLCKSKQKEKMQQENNRNTPLIDCQLPQQEKMNQQQYMPSQMESLKEDKNQKLTQFQCLNPSQEIKKIPNKYSYSDNQQQTQIQIDFLVKLPDNQNNDNQTNQRQKANNRIPSNYSYNNQNFFEEKQQINIQTKKDNFDNTESFNVNIEQDKLQQQVYTDEFIIIPKIKQKIEITSQIDKINQDNKFCIQIDNQRPKSDVEVKEPKPSPKPPNPNPPNPNPPNPNPPNPNPPNPNPPNPNPPDSLLLISQLYKESSQSRLIEQQFRPYVRDLLEKQDFRKHYSLNLQTSNKLFNYCNQLRLVRGDGNCFYTAFGYQFLSILLNDYSADQFKQFIEKIKSIKLPMKIYLQGNDFKIDDKELEEELLQNFLDRLIKLKNIQDENQRQAEFHVQFAAYEKQSETIDSCFYGLSTLFFRNYSNYILDYSQSKDAVFDRENLLLWEQECNSNEVIIAELAKSLNIFILLIFIVNGSNFQTNQYGNEQNNKIILIMKPGHYNIAYLHKPETKNEQIDDKVIQEVFNHQIQGIEYLKKDCQDQIRIFQE